MTAAAAAGEGSQVGRRRDGRGERAVRGVGVLRRRRDGPAGAAPRPRRRRGGADRAGPPPRPPAAVRSTRASSSGSARPARAPRRSPRRRGRRRRARRSSVGSSVMVAALDGPGRCPGSLRDRRAARRARPGPGRCASGRCRRGSRAPRRSRRSRAGRGRGARPGPGTRAGPGRARRRCRGGRRPPARSTGRRPPGSCRADRSSSSDTDRATLAPAQLVEAGVGGDPVRPRSRTDDRPSKRGRPRTIAISASCVASSASASLPVRRRQTAWMRSWWRRRRSSSARGRRPAPRSTRSSSSGSATAVGAYPGVRGRADQPEACTSAMLDPAVVAHAGDPDEDGARRGGRRGRTRRPGDRGPAAVATGSPQSPVGSGSAR